MNETVKVTAVIEVPRKNTGKAVAALKKLGDVQGFLVKAVGPVAPLFPELAAQELSRPTQKAGPRKARAYSMLPCMICGRVTQVRYGAQRLCKSCQNVAGEVQA